MRRKKTKDEPAPTARAKEMVARPFATALVEMKKALAAPTPVPVARPNAAKPSAQPQKQNAKIAAAPARPHDPLGHHAYEDRAAFHQAFAGVRPLHDHASSSAHTPTTKLGDEDRALRAKVAADLAAADEAARARLDALVAGNVGFVVRRSTRDGEIEALREGDREQVLRTITGPRVTPQGSVDLHGLTGQEAERELARFLRSRHARGDRTLLVVHGKGLHSDGGHGVLEDHVVRCLTEGGASVLVRAFVTAPERFGGRGALIVRLADR